MGKPRRRGSKNMTAQRKSKAKASASESPRRVLVRARHLTQETSRILKKRGRHLTPEVRDSVEQVLAQTASLLPQRRWARRPEDPQALALAADALQEALESHLGLYRKSVVREYIESIAWAFGLALIIRAFIFEAFSIPSGSMLPTLHLGDHLFVDKISYGLFKPFSASRLVHWSEPKRGEIIVFEFRQAGHENDEEDYIKRVVGLPGDRVALRDNVLWLNGERVPTEIIAETTCPIYNRHAQEVARCPCVMQRETLDGNQFVSQHQVGDYACGNAPDWPLKDCATLGQAACDETSHCTWATPGTWGGGDSTKRCQYIQNNGMNEGFGQDEYLVPEGEVLVMGDNRDHSQDGRFWGTVPFDRIKGSAFLIWLNWDKSERVFTWL